MDDFRKIWQHQEVESMTFTADELRKRAVKFQGRIKGRNLREQAACLLGILAFGAMALKGTQTIPRIGSALIVLGVLYIAWHLQAKGAPKSLPAEMARATCVGFYRSELERQRDLLSNVWKWYLGPLIPGMALLILFGIANAPPERRWFPSAYAVSAVVFFWFVGRLNRRAAERLHRQMAELDRELPDRPEQG